MDFERVIKANESIGKPTITKKTVNRYLSGLGAFCRWLVVNDYLTANPVEGLYLRLEKKSKRRPFTIPEMNRLFAEAPLFNGCATSDRIGDPGTFRVRDHRFWLPLVMLFSGCRPAEIAQLAVGDVRQEHGIWIMHITDADDEQSVKTTGSKRIVPVHSELIRLGFIAFCQRQAERGLARIFPEAERNSRGQLAATFSRDFTRTVLKGIGLDKAGELSLYSFRHGFVDALRRAGYLDEQFGFLVGHAKASTTGLYGVIPQGMLQQRVEMIEKVAYPGLDISHLYRS
jgi:integrase